MKLFLTHTQRQAEGDGVESGEQGGRVIMKRFFRDEVFKNNKRFTFV